MSGRYLICTQANGGCELFLLLLSCVESTEGGKGMIGRGNAECGRGTTSSRSLWVKDNSGPVKAIRYRCNEIPTTQPLCPASILPSTRQAQAGQSNRPQFKMSYNLLPGKTVVITGSATGIGRATAIGKSHSHTAEELGQEPGRS